MNVKSDKDRSELNMSTLDKPTASLSAAIGALAWMAILLNLVKYQRNNVD